MAAPGHLPGHSQPAGRPRRARLSPPRVRAAPDMSGAAGSGVPHAGEPQREPGVPLELPAVAGEASGDPSVEEESGGSGGEAGAAADEEPETRSVCSSESGSGSHPGGAGPICKICFQGPEQVRRHLAERAPISTADSARRLPPAARCRPPAALPIGSASSGC